MMYLKPILPNMAAEASTFLNDDLQWEDKSKPLLGHKIEKFKPLMQRIEKDQVDAMIEANKETIESAQSAPAKTGILAEEPIADEIEFPDFAKIDLRVATIVEASHVEGADKLLQLSLDIGGETRNVFSGIKSKYTPEDLVGKQTVLVANLKPRKMRFGVSEGMVLCAAQGDELFLLDVDEGAKSGMRVT